MLPGGRDLARRAVGQAGVGPVVVAVDVGRDGGAGLIEGFELLAPDEALLELGEPRLDERLALGVAVAAAAVRDAVLGEAGAERAAGERGAIVGAQSQRPGPDIALGDRVVDDRGRLGGAAADIERPAGDL